MSDQWREIARISDPLRRTLALVATVTELLADEGVRPILVGGMALQFYTLGGYVTADVDVVASRRDRVGRVLDQLGFKHQPGFRHWIHEELDLAIEIPDEVLAGSLDRVAEVEVDGKTAYVIGIEDLIVDRLNASKHWHSKLDGEWAQRLLAMYDDEIDHQYLREACEREQTLDALQECRQKAAEFRERQD